MTGGDTEPGGGKVRVGDTDIGTSQWTPYQEYLKPQKAGASLLFGGMPQNIAGMAAGKDMSFGMPRGLTKKDSSALDDIAAYGKKSLDIIPIPGVYKALFRAGGDVVTKNRNPAEAAVDRLFISNKPKKTSRSKKRGRK